VLHALSRPWSLKFESRERPVRPSPSCFLSQHGRVAAADVTTPLRCEIAGPSLLSGFIYRLYLLCFCFISGNTRTQHEKRNYPPGPKQTSRAAVTEINMNANVKALRKDFPKEKICHGDAPQTARSSASVETARFSLCDERFKAGTGLSGIGFNFNRPERSRTRDARSSLTNETFFPVHRFLPEAFRRQAALISFSCSIHILGSWYGNNNKHQTDK
jgi:hypothetical protein